MDIVGILGNVGFDWRVFLFNVINFTILLFLLRKFFFGKIVSVIEQREKIISEGLENANKAKEDLEKTEVTCKEVLAQAKEDSLKIIDEAKQEANTIVEAGRENAQTQAEDIVKKAKQDSENAKQKIMAEVQSNIAQIVTSELKNKIEK